MVKYQGLFFGKEIYDKVLKNLEKGIENPHITFDFNPNENIVFDDSLIGKEFEVNVVAFGYDEKACGFTIELPEELLPLYHGVKRMHITTSISDIGKAFDTGKIDNYLWKAIKPFKATGKLGCFIDGKVISTIKI